MHTARKLQWCNTALASHGCIEFCNCIALRYFSPSPMQAALAVASRTIGICTASGAQLLTRARMLTCPSAATTDFCLQLLQFGTSSLLLLRRREGFIFMRVSENLDNRVFSRCLVLDDFVSKVRVLDRDAVDAGCKEDNSASEDHTRRSHG